MDDITYSGSITLGGNDHSFSFGIYPVELQCTQSFKSQINIKDALGADFVITGGTFDADIIAFNNSLIAPISLASGVAMTTGSPLEFTVAKDVITDAYGKILYSKAGSSIIRVTLSDGNSKVIIDQRVTFVPTDYVTTDDGGLTIAAAYITFTAGDPADWNAVHTAINPAIDELAARTEILENAVNGDMEASTYDPTAVAGDAFLRSNMAGTQAFSTISDGDAQFARWDGSTGIYHADPLAINANPTLYDVGAIKGYIMTTGAVPTRVHKEFAATTGHASAYMGQAVTRIARNSAGTIVEIGGNTEWTETQRRTLLIIGQITHIDGVNITEVALRPNLISGTATRLQTLAEVVGKSNIEGNLFSAVSATLSMQKTSGSIYSFASNADDANNPDTLAQASINPCSIQHTDRNGVTSETNFIDPNNYDLAGTLTSMPVNKWSIQQIWLFSDNNIAVAYGNDTYGNSADALAAASTENPVLLASLPSFGVLRGYIICQEGETDSDNFIFQEYTGTSSGGGGASSGGGGILPTAADNDKTTAYTILAADIADGKVITYSGSADAKFTLDVSLLTTFSDVINFENKSAYILQIEVSNTGTMTINETKADLFLSGAGVLTLAGDTATNCRTVAGW